MENCSDDRICFAVASRAGEYSIWQELVFYPLCLTDSF